MIWQNDKAKTQIWHQTAIDDFLNDEMDVFDIILASQFQNTVNNWRQWVAFFIQQALAMVSIDELERLFSVKDGLAR